MPQPRLLAWQDFVFQSDYPFQTTLYTILDGVELIECLVLNSICKKYDRILDALDLILEMSDLLILLDLSQMVQYLFVIPFCASPECKHSRQYQRTVESVQFVNKVVDLLR
jgi:hypothetical protein